MDKVRQQEIEFFTRIEATLQQQLVIMLANKFEVTQEMTSRVKTDVEKAQWWIDALKRGAVLTIPEEKQ